MDPRLQSIHLEAVPRREEFRRARAVLNDAVGSRTLAGDLCAPLSPDLMAGVTCAPEQQEIEKGTGKAIAWLLDRGRAIALKVGLNSIGRLPDNDIVIEDACVSRRHCAILVHSDRACELHDIASKNGTTINGNKLAQPTRLNAGDVICLCERKLTFVTDLLQQTNSPNSSKAIPEHEEMTLVTG